MNVGRLVVAASRSRHTFRRATAGARLERHKRPPAWGVFFITCDRFRALGRRQYVALGSEAEGWTKAKAEEQLRRELMRVELDIWQPPKPAPAPAGPEQQADPTFHKFASEWFNDNSGSCRPK